MTHAIFLMLILVSSSLFAPNVWAQTKLEYSASFFQIKDPTKVVVNLKMTETEFKSGGENLLRIDAVSTAPLHPDQPLLTEKGILFGEQVRSYEVEQKQTDERVSIEIKKDQAEVSYSEKGESRKTQFKVIQPFIVPANFVAYIMKNWDQLKSDKKTLVQFFVWQLHDSYKFDLIYRGAEKVEGQELEHFTLKPNSFLLSFLANPIEMWFDPNTKRIMRYIGRVSPKLTVIKGDSTKFENFDALVIYTYK